MDEESWRRHLEEASGGVIGSPGSSLGTLWGSMEAGAALGWPWAGLDKKSKLCIVKHSKNEKGNHFVREWRRSMSPSTVKHNEFSRPPTWHQPV